MSLNISNLMAKSSLATQLKKTNGKFNNLKREEKLRKNRREKVEVSSSVHGRPS